MTAALLFVVLGLVVTTAALTVLTIGTRNVVPFLLGVYIVAWTEVVCLAYVLSLFHAFTRTGLVAGSILACAAAGVAWALAGRSRPPAPRPALQYMRTMTGDPLLAILALTVAFVIVYAIVLGVATPQNEWDSLTYHLTRAAFWIQQGAIGYVPHASDVRVNGNPPNAEIGLAWTMLLDGSDRFVWMPSLAAVPALMLGIFGVARRAGLHPREALFGALVFGCLPLVVLQASTALNDLVVASFFLAATYFAMGEGRAGALAAGLSLGLGCGTKISAPLLLPIYLVVVLVSRRRGFVKQCAIGILGIAVGGFWYALNLAHTGALDGGIAAAGGQTPDRRPIFVLTRAYQLLLNTVELPGGWQWGTAAMLGCAAVLALSAVTLSIRDRGLFWRPLAAGGAIVFVTPTLLEVEGRGLARIWHTGWAAVGRHDIADRIAPFNLSTVSDSASTWYGPVGALLIFGGAVLAWRAAGSRRQLRMVLALAPLAFLVVLAASVIWDPWRGRFFVFPIALGAAAWGLAYRSRALAWAAVGLTVVTLPFLVVNSYTKPLGIRLLGQNTTTSVFGKPRWRVETWTRDDGTEDVVEYVEKHTPPDASIGLSLGQDDFSYPYFGPHLLRTVRFLLPGEPVSADESWIVEAPGRDVPRCAASWETTLGTDTGFHVLRRTATDTC